MQRRLLIVAPGGQTGEFINVRGREPSIEEIAEQMEIPLDKVQEVLKIVKEPIDRAGTAFCG
jgi:hypothetical protein